MLKLLYLVGPDEMAYSESYQVDQNSYATDWQHVGSGDTVTRLDPSQSNGADVLMRHDWYNLFSLAEGSTAEYGEKRYVVAETYRIKAEELNTSYFKPGTLVLLTCVNGMSERLIKIAEPITNA